MHYTKHIFLRGIFSLLLPCAAHAASPTWRLAVKDVDSTAVYIDTASIINLPTKIGIPITNATIRFDLGAPDSETGTTRLVIEYQFFCTVQEFKMLHQYFYAADGHLVKSINDEIGADELRENTSLYKAAYDVCWSVGQSKEWTVPP
jgi:hypothetical protein